MTKIGFSTSTIQSIRDIDLILKNYPSEIIEICNCSLENLPFLKESLRKNNIEFGLHCPLPFTGWMTHFDITGPDKKKQKEAFALVNETFQTANNLQAAYVLIHFPTVFLDMKKYQELISSPDEYWEQIMQAADQLERISIENDMPLLLENVGPNPYFFHSKHFVEIFKSFPKLRMCLDLGHHYVIPTGEPIEQFVENVAPYVSSTHIYNTSLDTYKVGHHSFPFESLSTEKGWMNLENLINKLMMKADLKYFIFEHTYKHDQNVGIEDLNWLIDLVKNNKPHHD